MPIGIGIDGCRRGWVGALVADDRLVALRIATSIALLVEQLSSSAGVTPDIAQAPILIDMPMGLPLDGSRCLDAALRELLPSARKSSVFGVPARTVLGATSHDEASARQRAACGRGLSIQSYGLLPKIAELDTWLRASPTHGERCFESHPELAFARFASDRTLAPKRTIEGRVARRRLLRRLGLRGITAQCDVRSRITEISTPPGPTRGLQPKCAEDDALDALVLALLANRPAQWQTVTDARAAQDCVGIPIRAIVPAAAPGGRLTRPTGGKQPS